MGTSRNVTFVLRYASVVAINLSVNRKKPIGRLRLPDWLVLFAQSGNSRCPMNVLLILALSSLEPLGLSPRFSTLFVYGASACLTLQDEVDIKRRVALSAKFPNTYLGYQCAFSTENRV